MYYIYSQNVHTSQKTYLIDLEGNKAKYSWTAAFNELRIQRDLFEKKGLKNTTWHSEKTT